MSDNNARGTAMTRDELKARAARSGLRLTDAQIDEIYGGYLYVAAMADRVRRNEGRAREAEPALIFRAGFED